MATITWARARKSLIVASRVDGKKSDSACKYVKLRPVEVSHHDEEEALGLDAVQLGGTAAVAGKAVGESERYLKLAPRSINIG